MSQPLTIFDKRLCSEACLYSFRDKEIARIRKEGEARMRGIDERKKLRLKKLKAKLADLDTELDRDLAEARKAHSYGHEYALSLARIANRYRKALTRSDFADPSPDLSKDVGALRDRVGFYLEEARRELEAQVILQPAKSRLLKALSGIYEALDRKKDAVRAREQLRLVASEPRGQDLRRNSRLLSSGMDFEVKTLELVRLLGFTGLTTSRSADGGIDVICGSRDRAMAAEGCAPWTPPPPARSLAG